MSVDDVLKKIPEKGFIKLSIDKVDLKKPEEKVALIRKGNALFNQKQYELAKRIFLTVGYTDGLIRLGDYYLGQNNPLEAFRMYWLAPSKRHVAAMTEKMAKIIKLWIDAKQKGIEIK